jgi:hypothetical protein
MTSFFIFLYLFGVVIVGVACLSEQRRHGSTDITHAIAAVAIGLFWPVLLAVAVVITINDPKR